MSKRSFSPNEDSKTSLGENVLVKVGLQSGHLHTQDALALCWQALDDISLQSTQHQRLKLLMELFDLRLVVDVRQVKLIRERDYETDYRQR